MSERSAGVGVWLPLIGRIMMATVFLFSASGKIAAFAATAALMASRGMPMVEVLLVIAIAIEVVAGIAMIVGWHTRIAAFALAVFLTTATLYFHNYWTYPAAQTTNQRNHFMKNVGFVGGLLFVIGMGAGPLSLDARRRATRG
jgi:putative oxidoreductase